MSGRVTAANRVAVTRLASIGDLPGLKWWVEPDSIVATDAVDSWTDKSGNGNTITETGANRPVVFASALDGYSAVKFTSASSHRLKKTNTPLISGTAFTFGLVLKVDASIADQWFFDNGVAGSSGTSVYQNGSAFAIEYNGVAIQNGNVISTTGYHILTYSVNGAGTQGAYRYDRVVSALGTPNIGFVKPAGTASLILGSRANLTNPSSVTVIAGFMCDRGLQVPQIEAAQNIWKAKYPSLA